MNSFLRFYRWGMTFKYAMCMYAMAILCTKWFVLVLQGESMMPAWDVFWMTLVGLALASVQYLCFEYRAPSPEDSLVPRTATYMLFSNVLVIGSAWLLNWFPGLPVWGYAVLIAVLNLGMLAMWVGVHIALKFDTDQLNKSLRTFQQKE